MKLKSVDCLPISPLPAKKVDDRVTVSVLLTQVHIYVKISITPSSVHSLKFNRVVFLYQAIKILDEMRPYRSIHNIRVITILIISYYDNIANIILKLNTLYLVKHFINRDLVSRVLTVSLSCIDSSNNEKKS